MKINAVPIFLMCALLASCNSQIPRPESLPAPPVPDPSSTAGAGVVEDEPVEEEVSRDPSIFLGNDRVVDMPPARPPVKLDGEAVSLNFEQAPVTEVVHSILGDILELDYVVEHPLTGELTLRTRTPVPRDQLLPVLESLLQANGITMVRDPNDRFFVSGSDQLRALLPAFGSPETTGAGFRNIVIPLSYISASGMAEILAPVAPESAFVRVDNARNLLVLAGTRNQLDGWLSIISTFDIDQLQGMSVGIFPLEHSTVEDIEEALTHLLGNGEETAGADLARVVRVMPLERLNSILVVTPRAHYIDRIRSWISRLDQSQDASSEPGLHVYEVQNGSATHLAGMLSRIYGGGGGTSGSGKQTGRDSGVAPGLSSMSTGSGSGGGSGSSSFDPPDTGSSEQRGGSFDLGDNVRVVADEVNNSLLVYAPYRDWRKIETALDQLDIMPNQVLIEASILEVTLTDGLEFGLEWYLQDSLGGGRTGESLLNLSEDGDIGPRQPGFSYAITNKAGVLRGVINALSEKSLVNVISSPSVMVLDNHTAAIHVGDQQPVRSSQSITDGGVSTTSINYRDTGVKLEVTPSVNAGRLVTMDVKQEVTDVGQVDNATGQRSFLNRNVSSRVAVRSGESVVLGGLIRDNRSRGKLGIPFLHTLPVVGNLFGRTTNNTSRTELLVFITPRVLRDDDELRDIGIEMRSRMQGLRHFDDLPDAVPGAPESDSGSKLSGGGEAPVDSGVAE